MNFSAMQHRMWCVASGMDIALNVIDRTVILQARKQLEWQINGQASRQVASVFYYSLWQPSPDQE